MTKPRGGPTVPTPTKSLYRGQNPVDVPLYSFADMVRYLRLQAGWFPHLWFDRPGGHPEDLEPPSKAAFTFRALVNVFLLSSEAKWLTLVHPHSRDVLLLASHGVEVVVTPTGDFRFIYGQNQDGVESPAMKLRKARVEFQDGEPVRFYPLTRDRFDAHSPRLIAIDPRYSLGNPILAERNIRVDVVAGRFRAGESVAKLAKDLEIPAAEVEEAIRYESGHHAPLGGVE